MSEYLGKNKVLGVEKVEGFTTPSGEEVIKVLLNNSHSKIMTKKAFDLLVTDKEVDDTNLQKKRLEVTVPQIIKTIIDYDLQWYEMEALLRSIKESIDIRFERASSYVWRGGDDTYFSPGEDPSLFWSVLEAQKILEDAKKDGEKKGDKN